MTTHVDDASERLDKWLWAARFFKTRSLAARAVAGGKVQVDGERAKPARAIRVGNRLQVHRDGLEWNVTVLQITRSRGPAAKAALLYAQDEASIVRRQEEIARRRESARYDPAPATRPDNKRDRRALARLKGR